MGRVAVVLPTSQSINLRGDVTRAFLDHIGRNVDELTPTPSRIDPQQVSILNPDAALHDPLLIASTVFNDSNEPHARDQWGAAEAILRTAETHKCSLVLVPPLGTGVFGWPVR